MDLLIHLWESFHNVYIYQVIMSYTLNILQFYLSIIPQENWKNMFLMNIIVGKTPQGEDLV